MCKCLFMWFILLCSIIIKDITSGCLCPIIGHHLLLLLHLSTLILGHYVPFGVQYGHAFNQTGNPGSVHSDKMFPPVATPHIHPNLQVPLVPIPYYSFPQDVASQYQQPPQAQIPKGRQIVPYNHQRQRQSKRNDRKHPQRDQITMSHAQLLPYLVQQGLIVTKEILHATFPYHARHNPNSSYACHARHKGNSTEDCWVFKAMV